MKKLASRCAALGLLLALPVAVWLCGLQPLLFIVTGLDAQVEEARFEQQRLDRVAARLPHAEQRLARVKAAVAGEQGWVRAANAEQAAATLQTLAKQVIETHAGVLQSVQVLPTGTEDNVVRIGVKLNGALASPDLAQVLLALERLQNPRVWVSELDIRSNDTAVRVVTNDEPRPKLSVQMIIVGYLPLGRDR